MTDTLFDLQPTLSVADLDEYAAYVTASGWDSSHFPFEWVRAGLAGLLGDEFPYRRYGRPEMLGLLDRARRVLAGTR